MANATLQQVEILMNELSAAERLLLIERAARGLRLSAPAEDWDAQLAAMAADPDIQREIAAINAEFAETERDGLKAEQWP